MTTITPNTGLTFEQFADKTAEKLDKIARENRLTRRLDYDMYMTYCMAASGGGAVSLLEVEGTFDRLDGQIGRSIARRAHELHERAARPLTGAGDQALYDTLIEAVRHARLTWFAEQQSLDLE